MKPISVQLYSLREDAQKDFVGVLKKVAAIGYRGVEPAGLYGLKPADVRKIVEDLGMVVSSNHGPWPTTENLDEVADTARLLGSDIVVSGFGPDAFCTRDAIRKTADTVNLMADKLAKLGLTLALHNHFWEFDRVDGRIAYDVLMEQCPHVACELDTYWAANFGAVDPAEQVARYRSRAVLLHIKDGPLERDKPMVAAGSGKLDFPRIIRAADEHVLRWLIVELDSCAGDMLTAIADSYRYLVGNGLALGKG